jgi:hypothetical protein
MTMLTVHQGAGNVPSRGPELLQMRQATSDHAFPWVDPNVTTACLI